MSESATENSSSSLNSAINYNDPYFLSSSDNSNSQLGQIIFNGDNYLNWSRSVRLALGAKNKLAFVDGTLTRPSADSSNLQKWVRNDYMVTGWILCSMEKNIAECFIFNHSARDLWLEIQERYGHSNAPQLYEIHKNLMSIEQNDDSIAVYYGKLKQVWDKLQIIEPFPDCTCGAMSKCSCGLLRKILEADQLRKLIQLITGLNKDYDQAKINLLSMDPLPSVNRAYHLLQQIEKQGALNLSSHSSEMSALLSVHNNQYNRPPSGSAGQRRDYRDSSKKQKFDRFCDHCKMKGHTKDVCFKIVGYPEWYKGSKGQGTQGNRSHNSQRFAGSVEEKENYSAGILGSSPLDFEIGSGSNVNNVVGTTATINPQVFSALYKEFVKIMQSTQVAPSTESFNSAVNFAGTLSATQTSGSLLTASQHVWIVDTGASDHMAFLLDMFANTHMLKQPIKIALPDGTYKLVDTVGTISLTPEITLYNVFYVPSFKHNLLSVGRLLDQNNLIAKFEKNSCCFQDLTTSNVKAVAMRHGGLYRFLREVPSSFLVQNKPVTVESYVSQASVHTCSLDIIHARLGHASLSKLQHLPFYSTINKTVDFHCEACVLAKHHKLPFTISTSIASACFDLVHIDLWGPYETPTLSGASKVKVIRSDNGTEIVQEFCGVLFSSKGIIHQKTLVGVPQQNGRVERKHRHLLETARALRLFANLPVRFWGECLLTSTYLINLMPSSVLSWKTPYEVLLKKLPDYENLRIVGCLCYAAVKSHDKLAPRARKCIFLGYPYAQKGYKLYDLISHKIILSRDVVFKENIFPFHQTKAVSEPTQLPLVNPALCPENELVDDSPINIPPFPSQHISSPSSSSGQQLTQSYTEQQNSDFSFSSESPSHSPSQTPTKISLPLTSSIPEQRKSSRSIQLPKKFSDYILSNTHKPQAHYTSFPLWR
ncbi:uncharacterized protein [Spinacia oleracea]|uniref:Integrase catalytic domain-containing protein n=1 Tax=Spinacia oleracea TaxID=3562 RepID=A0ABM3RGR3_SPIOL|nr:uncharacterized protein LOC130469488 [Spinacia oleracea]